MILIIITRYARIEYFDGVIGLSGAAATAPGHHKHPAVFTPLSHQAATITRQ